MSLVRVKRKHQVTIPVKIREMLELDEGDLLNVEVEGNRIVLTPQVAVERLDIRAAIQEGLEDVKQDRVTPAFESMEEFEAYRQTDAYRELIESE